MHPLILLAPLGIAWVYAVLLLSGRSERMRLKAWLIRKTPCWVSGCIWGSWSFMGSGEDAVASRHCLRCGRYDYLPNSSAKTRAAR